MTVNTGGSSALGAPLPLGSLKAASAMAPALQDGFNEHKAPPSKPIASAPPAPAKLGPELAEDLNEEIKNKYTKGKFNLPSQFTIHGAPS